MDNGKGVENSTFTSSIFEEYLLTEDIVRDKGNHSSIFICGVQSSFMYWRIGTRQSLLGFNIQIDNIGRWRKYEKQGAATAVAIAQEPYHIVSVFLVTATSDVTVTCGDRSQNEVSLTSRYDSSTSVPTVQTDPEIVSSSTLGKWSLYTYRSDISVCYM